MNLREKLEIKLTYPDSVFTGHRTYSSLFLCPIFDVMFDSEISAYLVNTYIDDADLKHFYKNPYFILLKTRNMDIVFREVDKALKKNKNFVYTYFVGTSDSELLYMYVFECPEEYQNDYERFIKGMYSTFSHKMKSRFARVVQDIDGKYVESPLYGVIYKTPAFKKKVESLIFLDPKERLDKDQEFFGKPERKIEVFRYADK